LQGEVALKGAAVKMLNLHLLRVEQIGDRRQEAVAGFLDDHAHVADAGGAHVEHDFLVIGPTRHSIANRFCDGGLAGAEDFTQLPISEIDL